MAKVQLKVKIVTPWWMPVYLRTLALACVVMGAEPDYDKVHAFITRHLKLKIIKE